MFRLVWFRINHQSINQSYSVDVSDIRYLISDLDCRDSHAKRGSFLLFSLCRCPINRGPSLPPSATRPASSFILSQVSGVIRLGSLRVHCHGCNKRDCEGIIPEQGLTILPDSNLNVD